MLRFSDSAKITAPVDLDCLLNNFLTQVAKIPGFETLKYCNEMSKLHVQLKNDILVEAQQAPILIEDIYNRFKKGQYDSVAFSDEPQKVEDLEVIIYKYPRDFVQRLFTKCKSEKAMTFWLDEIQVPLPKDTWALAVNLGNNIFVLHSLKEKGYFDNLSIEDKEGLLSRAKRFEGEGLEYLKQEFKCGENFKCGL